MEVIRVKFGNKSFKKTSGTSKRDEIQLLTLVEKHKCQNRTMWSLIQRDFCPEDKARWGSTKKSALRSLYKRRLDEGIILSEDFLLSEEDLSEPIEVSSSFDKFLDEIEMTEDIFLSNRLNDLVKAMHSVLPE